MPEVHVSALPSWPSIRWAAQPVHAAMVQVACTWMLPPHTCDCGRVHACLQYGSPAHSGSCGLFRTLSSLSVLPA